MSICSEYNKNKLKNHRIVIKKFKNCHSGDVFFAIAADQC